MNISRLPGVESLTMLIPNPPLMAGQPQSGVGWLRYHRPTERMTRSLMVAVSIVRCSVMTWLWIWPSGGSVRDVGGATI
jgi:hypothetical protein